MDGKHNRYTRNLVDAGNGKFNLMIICWGEGHGSAIHDHADSHCFMKMLKGELREIRYAWPNDSDTNNNNAELDQSADISASMNGEAVMYNGSELQELSRCIMETNSVHYINGNFYVHFFRIFVNFVGVCFDFVWNQTKIKAKYGQMKTTHRWLKTQHTKNKISPKNSNALVNLLILTNRYARATSCRESKPHGRCRFVAFILSTVRFMFHIQSENGQTD